MPALRPGLTPLLAAALLLAACGSSGPQSQATNRAPTPTSPAAASPTAGPAGSPSAAPAATSSRPPAASPTPGSTAPATAKPSASVSPTTGASAGPLGTPGDLASCTGTDDNRIFFSSVAAKASWDVYCPALPKGWYVDKGNYASGLLTIAYRTSGSLRLELKEGAVCSGTPAACAPMDTSVGTSMYGDRQGQLGRLAGNLVLYVDPGANPSWQATGIGLDEATFRSFCAALVKVPG